MTAAVKSLKEILHGKRAILIFGVLADKDYEGMLRLLLPLAKKIFCVSPDSQRALKADALAETIRKLFRTMAGREEACVEDDPGQIPEVRPFAGVGDAIDAAFAAASEKDVICALGSLYMIGDIKSYMARYQKEKDDETH